MATLDLTPLSDEKIDQLQINNHDLWMIRVDKSVQGPFHTQDLKDYASNNEELFQNAQASRLDEMQFRPFWSYPQFQRRGPQVINFEPHHHRFWLLEKGQKTGPHSFAVIDQKILKGELVLTDLVSTDEGHHWKKIFEIEDFDRRRHSSSELPLAPSEGSFNQAKLHLVENSERQQNKTKEEVAQMCFEGKGAKVLDLKIDEMTLNSHHTPSVSKNTKWLMPSAAAFMVVLLTAGYFSFSPEMIPLEEEKVASNSANKPFYRPSPPQGVVPQVERSPASVGHVTRPMPGRSFNQDARFPTIMETHNNDRPQHETPVDADYPQDDYNRQSEPEIHSLVNNGAPEEDQSLDAAMNGIEQPVIEEASDF